MKDWFIDILVGALRFIAYWIDSFIAWLVGLLYGLIVDIAMVKFSFDSISGIISRIYVLLAIFMLFKIAFSLINYIISPDSMNDKNVGSTKLIRNVLISLLLIVAVPFIFEQALKVQSFVLGQNMIEKIVFGGAGYNNEENQSTIKDSGKRTAFLLYSSMIYPNYEKHERLKVCEKINELTIEGCADELDKIQPELGESYRKILEAEDVQALLSSEIIMTKYNGEYVFKYNGMISIIAGGVMIFVFLSLAIAIAVRLVKLTFLQVISPIPIMSYMDPKSGDKGMFQNWLKTCISTYLELFIRLAAIFFGVFAIITLANNAELVKDDVQSVGWFVKTIIIIGILIFINHIPKLFESLFPGFKGAGFSLNPMKQINDSPLAASVVKGGVGGVLGAGAGAAANFIAGKGFGQTAGSTIAGAFGGARRGVLGGIKAGSKGSITDVVNQARLGAINARDRRAAIQKYNTEAMAAGLPGYGFWDRNVSERVQKFAGIKNKESGVGFMDAKTKEYKELLENYKEQESSFRRAQSQFLMENASRWSPEVFESLVENPDDPSKRRYLSYEEHVERFNNVQGRLMQSELEAVQNNFDPIDRDKIAEEFRLEHGGPNAILTPDLQQQLSERIRQAEAERESLITQEQERIKERYQKYLLSEDAYTQYVNISKAIDHYHDRGDKLRKEISRIEKVIMNANEAKDKKK